MVAGSLLLFTLVVVALVVLGKYRHLEFLLTHGGEEYVVIATEPLAALAQPPEGWKEVAFEGGSLSVPAETQVDILTIEDEEFTATYKMIDLGDGHKVGIFDDDTMPPTSDEIGECLGMLPEGVPLKKIPQQASVYAAPPQEFTWSMSRDELFALDYKLGNKRIMCSSNAGAVFLRSEASWDGILVVRDHNATFAWESHDWQHRGSLFLEGANLQDYAWAKLICASMKLDTPARQAAK